MKKIILFSLLINCFALTACRKTPAEDDPMDGDLPAYTEKGKNIAGAYVNGDPWIAKQKSVDFGRTDQAMYMNNVYTSTADSTVFMFPGTIDKGFLKGAYITIYVVIKGLSLRNENDLGLLNNRDFKLDGVNNYVYMQGSKVSQVYQYPSLPTVALDTRGTGNFYVKRAYTPPPSSEYPSIMRWTELSGVFDFDFGSTKVTSGRFDIHYHRQFSPYF